jgi:hypothetical protein
MAAARLASEADVAAWAEAKGRGALAFNRAKKEVLGASKLSGVDVQGNGCESLTATCTGSKGEAYDVRVGVPAEGDVTHRCAHVSAAALRNKARAHAHTTDSGFACAFPWHNSCTCPAQPPCKHTLALLLWRHMHVRAGVDALRGCACQRKRVCPS